MEDSDMKNRLIEAFTDQLKTKASKESGKKPLFFDASYEHNTKSFQMHHQKPGRVRSLTLGEVSGEIHHIKSEISAIKAQIAELQKGKQVAASQKYEEEEDEDDPWNQATHAQEVQIAEDIPVDCILGNIFLATVEPHGSARLKGRISGYFISVPTSRGKKKKIVLPYVSSPRVSTMVQAMQKLDKAESLLTYLKDLKEEPNAFWHRKQHTIRLPYKEGFARKPCKSRAIPISKEYRDLCQKEIQQLLDKRLIRESNSPWNCYGFYVKKRAEQIRGIPRLVINYKPLNSVLADDTYPIPHKGDLIRRIAGAKIFSKFDLKARFWQVAIEESDKFKTAFSIPAGHYEWNVMPFGLKNAPSKFQKVMDDIFKPYFNWLIVYIDDVLIFSKNIDEHFKHISLQQHAIDFADKFPNVLKDKTQLQRFLGCLNYVSNFYQDCASDRKILNRRLGKNPPEWSDLNTKVVQEIKAKVKSLPILYVVDDQAFKIVESDASNVGWGGVLKQKIGKEEQVVQFASRV
eukprot:PITA_16901